MFSPNIKIFWFIPLIIAVIYYINKSFNRNLFLSNIEGYQSLEDCKNQGYPHAFCMNVPIQSVISDSYCNCHNRELGTLDKYNNCHCLPYNPETQI